MEKSTIVNILLDRSSIADIAAKVEAGERLTFEDGVRLFNSPELAAVGYLADIVRRRKNGDRTYYVVNRHINYTDICKNRCKFCAFSRNIGEDGAYAMTVPEVVEKAEAYYDYLKFTELHIVGGLHPKLPFEYYTGMLSSLRDRFPKVHLQAFTAVEIKHLSEIGGFTVEEALLRLKDAGLGSIPGGGAEVFASHARNEICPEKISGEEWLSVMLTAHSLGIRSNATMLYGHVETVEERVDHLIRLREGQDAALQTLRQAQGDSKGAQGDMVRAAGGIGGAQGDVGFMAFIPLRFHPMHTRLSHITQPPSGMDDLKMIAISRLMLDNFEHIKVFWIMFGLKLAQVALSFGADDFDGTVVEEKITHRAGAETPEGLTVEDIRRMIRETGTLPVERDTIYREVTRNEAGMPSVSKR